MRFITWLVTNVIALAIALLVVPGLWISGATSGTEEVQEKIVPLLIVAAVLGTITSFVKPIIKLLSLPLIILTLGLFLLIVNAIVLWLTSWLYDELLADSIGHTFNVDGFWAAIFGGLIIAIVGAIVGRALEPKK